MKRKIQVLLVLCLGISFQSKAHEPLPGHDSILEMPSIDFGDLDALEKWVLAQPNQSPEMAFMEPGDMAQTLQDNKKRIGGFWYGCILNVFGPILVDMQGDSQQTKMALLGCITQDVVLISLGLLLI